jgi:hypothetical protein
MEFTFGIGTIKNDVYDHIQFINEIIDSIELQGIEKYEIIIVGNIAISRKNTIIISFDETIYPGWTSRKKNIITQYAKYENIVFMRDYIKLHKDWYNGYLQFGNDFEIANNIILDTDNTRYRDLCLNMNFCHGQHLIVEQTQPEPGKSDVWIDNYKPVFETNLNSWQVLIDYDVNLEKIKEYIYISGSYWVVKKYVMIDCPINENLLQLQSDDIEWSQRVLQKYKYTFNKHSICNLLKWKCSSYLVYYG